MFLINTKIVRLTLFVFFAIGCRNSSFVVKQQGYQNYKIHDSLDIDSSLFNSFSSYRMALQEQMSEVIGHAQENMIRQRPESALGNFFADALFRFYSDTNILTPKPDFALFNYGGIRASLSAGEITRGEIFEIMPFENELVLVKLSGDKLHTMFQYIIEKGGEPISHMKLHFKNDTLQMCLINEMPYQSEKTYWVLTSDYLAQGGDKMEFFKNPVEYVTTGIKIRDALMNYVKNSPGVIQAKLDQRIIFE